MTVARKPAPRAKNRNPALTRRGEPGFALTHGSFPAPSKVPPMHHAHDGAVSAAPARK